ncbi:hypothetical protein YPPY48_0830, partial [Yersinia pestis PY-48]|jgi:hypothetical protein
MLKP